MEKHTMVVTVSRQMGSGGTFIGYALARRLGFTYVDREILSRAASLLKGDETAVAAREETSSGLLRNLLRTFSLGTPEVTYVPKERPIYDRDLFLLQSKVIREIADRSDSVIMGRGGFSLFRDRPQTVHLFVQAPRRYRVDRVIEAEGAANEREALAAIDESDQRRARFIKDMCGREWTDARNYHLCIDSSCTGPEETVRMVAGFVGRALNLVPPVDGLHEVEEG
jgi:cytidylate kinase